MRKLVAASSASVYGLADEFPTTEGHHPYANDTLYGAAKVFNEGLLRSYHAMYGLDYVALRYFNVYGPRMDVHGVYTEVLVRWMERIAAGKPPLIFGDGIADDGLRLRRATSRARTCSPPRPTSPTRSSTSPAASRPACNELAETLLRVMGSDLAVEYGPERAVNGVHAAPGRHRRRARASSASRPRSASRRASRRLVEWWRASAERAAAQPVASLRRGGAVMEVPFAKPCLGGGEAEAVAEVIASGWVSQGPRVARVRAGVRRARGRSRRRGDDELHHGAAPRALRLRRRARATR